MCAFLFWVHFLTPCSTLSCFRLVDCLLRENVLSMKACVNIAIYLQVLSCFINGGKNNAKDDTTDLSYKENKTRIMP